MALRKGASVALAGLGAATAYRYTDVKAREGKLPTEELAVFDKMGAVAKDPKKQRVLIIGAGVVGVTTAYKLALRGHQVAILEPNPKAGEECSACAAGGMSVQNTVVDKNTWIAVLRCLAPAWVRRAVWGPGDYHFNFFQIDWVNSLSDPFFLRWSSTFTRTSFFPDSHHDEAQAEMLKFTEFAVQDMVNMFEDRRDDMSEKAGYNKRGSLAVSYDEPPGSAGSPVAGDSKGKKASNTLEPNRRVESTDDVLKEEPSLKFQATPPIAAKYEYEAKSASSGRFSKELARRCVTDPKLEVSICYNTKVLGIGTTKTSAGKQRISELRTNRGVISVPEDVHVVVAAGAWTPHISALMGLYAPVYPLKGYAMSVSAKEALKMNPSLKPEDLPSRIVCDKYMYTTRLGDEIRITSIGEFSEWNADPTPHVDQNFRQEAIRQFPQLSDLIPQAKTLCGHRPYVSDGLLLLGACDDTFDKLYVSCGPGSNGWKLAMGSGEVVARLISGQTTEQIKDELGFDPQAFSPAGRVKHSPIFAKICRARWNV